MSHSMRTPLVRRRASALLALAILALAMHALASMGLMRKPAQAGELVTLEICTSHGLVQLEPAQSARGSSQQRQPRHECCDLCAACGSLLAAPFNPPMFASVQRAAGAIPYERHHRAHSAATAHFARGPPRQA
jgi:hypothetical protein